MTERETLKEAVQVIRKLTQNNPLPVEEHDRITNVLLSLLSAIESLEQPEQKPKVWGLPNASGDILDVISTEEHERLEGGYTVALYTTPPQRTWVGLTDDEIDQGLLRSDYAFKTAEAWRAGVVFAMTKLKEKNA